MSLAKLLADKPVFVITLFSIWRGHLKMYFYCFTLAFILARDQSECPVGLGTFLDREAPAIGRSMAWRPRKRNAKCLRIKLKTESKSNNKINNAVYIEESRGRKHAGGFIRLAGESL